MTTALPIKIRKINKANISAVKKLVTDVFMEFEAPDYSYEGVKAFFGVIIVSVILAVHKPIKRIRDAAIVESISAW